jgi:hypothetical protein
MKGWEHDLVQTAEAEFRFELDPACLQGQGVRVSRQACHELFEECGLSRARVANDVQRAAFATAALGKVQQRLDLTLAPDQPPGAELATPSGPAPGFGARQDGCLESERKGPRGLLRRRFGGVRPGGFGGR